MEKTIFVIMPFSATSTCTEAEWTEIFENIFRPSAEEAGYSCERVTPTTGSLTASIIEKLHNAPIVLADITDRNPNVFYELGIRHALSKRTIVTTQDGLHVPSDLKGYWYLTYGIRPAEVSNFKRSMAKLVRQIEADPERSDSPVADYFSRTGREVFSFVAKDNLKKLNALCTELTGNIIALEQGEASLPSTDCLQLLLQTLYIDPGPAVLKVAYELYLDLRRLSRAGSADTWPSGTPIRKASELLEEMSCLRRALSLGQFSEPSEPSYMIWSTSAGSRVCSQSIPLSSFRCYGAEEQPLSLDCLPAPSKVTGSTLSKPTRETNDKRKRPTQGLKRTPDGAA